MTKLSLLYPMKSNCVRCYHRDQQPLYCKAYYKHYSKAQSSSQAEYVSPQQTLDKEMQLQLIKKTAFQILQASCSLSACHSFNVTNLRSALAVHLQFKFEKIFKQCHFTNPWEGRKSHVVENGTLCSLEENSDWSFIDKSQCLFTITDGKPLHHALWLEHILCVSGTCGVVGRAICSAPMLKSSPVFFNLYI